MKIKFYAFEQVKHSLSYIYVRMKFYAFEQVKNSFIYVTMKPFPFEHILDYVTFLFNNLPFMHLQVMPLRDKCYNLYRNKLQKIKR